MDIVECASAARPGESKAELRWDDLDLVARELTVRHGKGGKQLRVIGESLTAALKALPEGDRVIGRSYPAAVERLRRLCIGVGAPYRGHHALRHSVGTRLTHEGASFGDVARHLGHSALETASIYAKWSDEGLKRRMAGWL